MCVCVYGVFIYKKNILAPWPSAVSKGEQIDPGQAISSLMV